MRKSIKSEMFFVTATIIAFSVNCTFSRTPTLLRRNIMRNKYVAWSLIITMLISTLFLSAGPFAPVSAAGGANLTQAKI